MAFRFRRAIKIAPGLRLNIGKKSLSVSAGIKGANVTAGTAGKRATVGIPGTGLAYSKKIGGKHTQDQPDASVHSLEPAPHPLRQRPLLLWTIRLLLLIAAVGIGFFLLTSS